MRGVAVGAVLLGVMAGTAGCHARPGATGAGAGGASQYPIRGTVEAIDRSTNEIDLNAGAVAGVMDAMTMTYKVVDPSAVSEMHRGDVISATLLADHDAAGIKNLRLKDVVIVGEAHVNIAPTVQYHVPAVGDEVPNFKLLNQSDQVIGLKQFRGKVLVMTFIYTRCPLADYCPRMSHNFAEIDKDLAADKSLYAKTHLLSVSFDPAYDTPKVLKSYGEAYTGEYVNATFKHWDFAAPPVAELPRVEQYFDVGVTPGQNGTLQHSLSTVVIGKDGKVVAFWPTNDWTVAEVLAKIQAAA